MLSAPSQPSAPAPRRPPPVVPGIIGSSHVTQQLRALVQRVAPSDVSVLVVGPSGSGKELVARGIHAASTRAGRPFVALNCAAIPPDLLESELFGAERGAFTGAGDGRPGRIEEADGGTLFLDEIGDMPLAMQAKLLRVLEERRVARLGGGRERPVDVRLVTATHRDLGRAIARGEFREDLFFRIAVFPLRVPSLAERTADIPELVAHFAGQLAAAGAAPLRFTAEALALLGRMAWRGNVRELRNLVERASVMAGPSGVVDAALAREMLAPARTGEVSDVVMTTEHPSGLPPFDGSRCDLDSVLGDLEQRYITAAIERAGGVVAEAARLLGLRRTTLLDRMRKHGIAAVRPHRRRAGDVMGPGVGAHTEADGPSRAALARPRGMRQPAPDPLCAVA